MAVRKNHTEAGIEQLFCVMQTTQGYVKVTNRHD